MLYLSLGLHGLLMMIPIPSTPESESSSPKKEPIKVTQLPSPPSPKPSPVVVQPKPSPTVQQNSLPTTRPQVQMPPVMPSALSNSTGRSLITESPKPSPSIQPSTSIFTPTPSPTPVASPIPTPSPTPVASPTPTPSPTPVASPTPTPTPTPTNLVAGVPNFDNAQLSCNGGCWHIKETPFRLVSTTLLERFENQGYEVDKQDIEDETGRSVYKVSKDGVIQYLNVLSTDKGDTVYLLAERELTRQELLEKSAL